MADAAASAVASTVAVEAYKDGRTLLAYFTRKIGYANDLDSNFNKMREEADKLYAKRDDVKKAVTRDKTKEMSRVCENWIRRIENKRKEVVELEKEYKKQSSRSWGCRRFWKRSNLSKRIAKKCNEVIRLCEERGDELGLMVERSPDPVIKRRARKIQDKSSLHWAVEEILGFLRDANVKRIGLWGIAGVGKTTIMENLNSNEHITEMFEFVIWLTVSKDWSIEKLQRAIVQRLKLNMEGITDPPEIAARISKELECKRYLLLLDEVWDVLDLHAVGIYDNQRDSKVVLATRYRDICFEMDADEFVNVKRLSNADALKMFREKVGQNINLPDVEPIAQLVVTQCAGIPLLIEKVAQTFKKKDNLHLWNDGLDTLRKLRSLKTQGTDEMLEFLKFCYDNLDGEDKKFCFLYGALYPEDCKIYSDYLLECWKAEGFIHDANNFKVARGKGHTILNALISLSLLERDGDIKHVRMNKVVRNMALKIALNENSRFLVRAREDILWPPKEEEWKQANRISLMDSELCTLPETPNCNDLSTLLLQRNRNLTMIPELFFGSMQNLHVLDLHATAITTLPSSLSCLTSLRALYLNSCIKLEALTSIMESLVQLELLDIRGTGINCLPVQIRFLTQLRCLRLSLSNVGMGGSGRFNSNKEIISNLKLLEELSIEVGPFNQSLDEVVKVIIEEVATLTQLISLSICFPGVECLQKFITSSSAWKDCHFTFSVGYHESSQYLILRHSEYNILRYANGEGVNGAISEVLSEAHAFELIGHKGASSLSDFGINSFNKMRGCLIEGCHDIETVISGSNISNDALKLLEKMLINNVPKLKSIWEGPVHAGSLACLTTVTICKCPLLKKIFSNGMIFNSSQNFNI